MGIGGIATIDDVMEFLVAGATAVQIGTANFYNPTVSIEILDALPAALADLGAAALPTWSARLRRAGSAKGCRGSCIWPRLREPRHVHPLLSIRSLTT